MNTQNIIEQYLHKKPDIFSRSIGVEFFLEKAIEEFAGGVGP
jgi:hypothetical protein